ncbi:MAG: hypothetical protein M0P16_01565 [Syntrophales bacterium]|nr:hypothetical protein [Syntrophales bacterium]
MITINSYLHRNELKDLIRRSMYGNVQTGDGDLITRLVHFNQFFVSRYLHHFAGTLFRELHGSDLRGERISLKGEIKDAMVRRPPYHNPRIERLIRDYEEHPGRFYRETPCQAMLFFKRQEEGEDYLGSWRIKRIRRLAEKGARRIIDWIFDAIKRHAETLADERAALLCIPREYLLTSPEEMLGEFLDAEERFVEDLQRQREIKGATDLVINDVAGVKVVLEDDEQGRILTALNNIEHCRVVEQERHQGLYNAVNLVVRIEPPKDELIRGLLPASVYAVMASRGVAPAQVDRNYADFVLSGEEDVYLEIIVSNYQEMLESEIGRCMHEDRTIAQRLRQQYRGHLAKNVEYLMRYLFLFTLSNQGELKDLPVKLWDRYVPDYFDGVIAGLFHIPPGDF